MPPFGILLPRLLFRTLRIPRPSYALHHNLPTRPFCLSHKLANPPPTILNSEAVVDVEGYARYEFPEIYDDREVWLFENKTKLRRPKLLKALTISQLLTTPIHHGVYINPRNDWCERLKLLNPNRVKIEYEILPLVAKPLDTMPGRILRMINFKVEDRPRDHAKRMHRMYSFLQDGQHCVVIVQMPTKKLNWGPGPAFDWVIVNTPHLRPEVMIKSMPEGTTMAMGPYAGYGEIVWVFGRGEKLNTKQTRRLHEKLLRNVRKGKARSEVESVEERVKNLSSGFYR
ncbi:hypothetical protein BU16DRAFT_378086 [Lophium mytilinum]|uniref:Uncharacterized protein n=1 Tax=Lophium mytilinum TaxID=390894 RepID=A0A6A6QXA3_9PEZI|nr:hypothetical protein BU16DRAFT_378086 [Lophium mytilinum]